LQFVNCILVLSLQSVLLLLEFSFQLVNFLLVFFQLFVIFVLIKEFVLFLFELKWLVLVNIEVRVHFNENFIESLC